MESQDTRTLLTTLATLRVSRATTDAEAMAAMLPLGMLDQSMLGLTRFLGQTPWECHPAGDELLFLLEGNVDVTIRDAEGRDTRFALAPGCVCVVPRALWHHQYAPNGAALLFATPIEGSSTSWDDPQSALSRGVEASKIRVP